VKKEKRAPTITKFQLSMLNLQQDMAPLSWEDYWGHDNEVISLLHAIDNGVETTPRSLTIYGYTGTGKTALVNLIIRSLNCSNPQPYTRAGVNFRQVNPCGECPMCKEVLDFRLNSSEYTNILHLQAGAYGSEEDSTHKLVKRGLEFGSKPAADLGFGREYFRFVIFDEWQIYDSKDRQKVLLKAELESHIKTIYFMITMQPEKLAEKDLSSVEDRGFPVYLRQADWTVVKDYLLSVSPKSGLPLLTEEVAEQIAKRAKGSFRRALSKYQQLALKDPYCDYIHIDTAKYFLQFTDPDDRRKLWDCIFKGNYYQLEEVIDRLMSVYERCNLEDFVNDLVSDVANAMRQQKGVHDHQLFAIRRLYEAADSRHSIEVKDYLLQLGGLDLGCC
jgi:DNA polymerase III delta prime subunit